ncbi:MAG: PaaI family thioesterase [Candidatus Desulfofervidaceae bacterium]|nr:PaaI family thioesterase [Candidatus Desulfofervidaceae bacterium]
MSMDSSYCFVCGPKNPKSLGIKVFYEGDIAKTRYTFAPEYQGWTNIIHGGLISTLLDEIMAYATARERPTVTTHLHVTFRNALHPGEEVIVSGWVKNKTKRKIEAAAEMRRVADNKVIATAEGTLLFVK